MKTLIQACALVLAIAALTACSQKTSPEPETPAPSTPEAPQDTAPITPDEPTEDTPKDSALKPIPGFDPMEGCSGPIEPHQIPPVPVRGAFIKDQGTELEVPFELKSGRVELHKDRVLIRLASEKLSECSPFLEGGGLAKETRIGVRLSNLATETFRFPDSGDDKKFRYWNYVYTAERDMPMTMNAFSTEDSGTVVIETIDEKNQVVTGKMLLCKANGQKGWAVGNFEIPLCDKRPPSPVPGDEIDPSQDR